MLDCKRDFNDVISLCSRSLEGSRVESSQQSLYVPVSGFYIGKPCPEVKKTHDFAMIAAFKHNKTNAFEFQRRNFQSRADVCEWLPETSGTVGACGPGAQCPALGASRFGFHVRGDTWGSNRLMDVIMSRSIPIFTAEEQYSILPSFYPWREVGYLADVSNKEKFKMDIESILHRPQAEIDHKLRLIDHYMYLLDHTQPYQFDRHMTEFSTRLGISS